MSAHANLSPESERHATRHETYWLGYRHGRRLAEYQHLSVDHEAALKLEVQLAGARHRAFALGELRGYREAVGRPC